MNHWLTRAGAPIRQDHVKRFDPLHWTVEFPRGAMASTITTVDGHGLVVTASFLRKGDLVGLSFESEDRFAHPAHARKSNRNYSQTVLSFRWQSIGLAGLDAVNGPTLTIEGRDSAGVAKIWLVRLWNYATGTPSNAQVTIDFDSLDGGFVLPADAQRVDPLDIDRIFVSLVPPGYVENSIERWPQAVAASVTLSSIRCDGAGSVLAINDAVTAEHGLRICTAYDDLYHLPPERIAQAIERLGYRGTINHYIGMSHYFGLGGNGLLDPAVPMNEPALAWHRDLARAVAARGYQMIWSLSYELLDMFCPVEWKQRASDGSVAATGYSPPSALVSPANSVAIAFLASVAKRLVEIAVEATLVPRLQVGEPWWWITPSGAICLYDDQAKLALGGNPVAIDDVSQPLTSAQISVLNQAGELLAQSTANIWQAARTANLATQTLLLVFNPGLLDPARPEVKRANLPLGWARPAFDILQLEDYDWLTAGLRSRRQLAVAEIEARLGYPPAQQHYLAGFVATANDRQQWEVIIEAAREARQRGVAETFLWALPQVLRDGLTLFGEDQAVRPFDDVVFPIEIGAETSVVPAFSTTVVTSASGHEHRNSNWSQARLRFDAGPGVRGDAELQQLIGFFRARRGQAVGFRFRDPFDFSSNGMTALPRPDDQVLGGGNSQTTSFPLIKSYGAERRRISRPVAQSVRVAIGGLELASGWSLETGGTVSFAIAPAAGAVVTAGFLFDVPVRFAEDRLEVNRASFLAGEAPSVPLVEIREG